MGEDNLSIPLGDPPTPPKGQAFDIRVEERKLSVKEEGELQDIQLRKRFALAIIFLTFMLNLFCIVFITYLAISDRSLVGQFSDKDPSRLLELAKSDIRLITPNVVMSIVAATVVQVGAAFFLITKYLFPARSDR